MKIVVVQSGLYITAAGTTSYTCIYNIILCTGTCAEAKLDLWLLLCMMCVYIHACATAKLESQRTAGRKTPGEGAAAAGRIKLLLHFCRIHERPGAPEDTRGIRRDTKGTGGHRDTTRTGGHSGGIGRDTKRTGGNNYGRIGASRKATRTQRPPGSTALRLYLLNFPQKMATRFSFFHFLGILNVFFFKLQFPFGA
jgi:hypothetical protein